MEQRKQKKYTLEKILHEIIRDLPEVEKVNRDLERGLSLTYESFYEIGRILKEQYDKKRKEELI